MKELLTSIAEKMDRLLPLFVDGGSLAGKILPSGPSAEFKGLASEAKSILDDDLGLLNDFSMKLIYAMNPPRGPISSGPSFALVEDTSAVIRAGVRTIERKNTRPPATPQDRSPFIDATRIVALQSMDTRKWDYSKLAALCCELNVAAANNCHMSAAMLLRTIIDHVPPVFGFTTFAGVANNYGSSRSFKASMQNLQRSLRNISDMHLHSPIRQREDLPTSVQVNFAADLDVLLGEIIRLDGPE